MSQYRRKDERIVKRPKRRIDVGMVSRLIEKMGENQKMLSRMEELEGGEVNWCPEEEDGNMDR